MTKLPDTDAGAAGQERSSAANRVLSVFEAVVTEAPRANLGAIAARAGLPKPTAHRLLQVLVRREYVFQLEDGIYEADLQILGMAARIQEMLDPAIRARPVMQRLQELLPETTHFAVLQGDHAVYVEKLEGRRGYRMASTIGMTAALHSTAIGKAILAFLPAEDRRRHIDATKLPRRTVRTITSMDALELELDRIRTCGYAIDDEENEEHIRCVGSAVFNHRGAVIGGVSLSAPAFALTIQQAHQLGPALATAGAEMSRSLGARDDQLPPAILNPVPEDLGVTASS